MKNEKTLKPESLAHKQIVLNLTCKELSGNTLKCFSIASS